MSDEEKNYGPVVSSGVLGVVLTEFLLNGVTKEELLEHCSKMIDGIKESIDPVQECPSCMGKRWPMIDNKVVECIACFGRGHISQGVQY